MIKRILLVILVVAIILNFNISLVIAVEPFGASVSPLTSERAPEDSAQGINAIAGNVTELNIFGFSVTQTWQGYFGNVTGVITLNDNSDNVMYNWSLTSPQGEIYASTNNSISWSNIQCLNFTATGTYASDTGNSGATSQFGTNLTILEGMFNIAPNDVDGVNETFNLLGTGHNRFFTNNLEFTEAECQNTRIFSDASQGEDGKFEEVLLYEPTTRSVIFTSLLNENLFGFDKKQHDFEMLVLEDGHGTDTSVATYYFYVELE
jgi:hypothetical protein